MHSFAGGPRLTEDYSFDELTCQVVFTFWILWVKRVRNDLSEANALPELHDAMSVAIKDGDDHEALTSDVASFETVVDACAREHICFETT